MKTILAKVLSVILSIYHGLFYLIFIPLMKLLYKLDQNELDEASDRMNSFAAKYAEIIFPDLEDDA